MASKKATERDGFRDGLYAASLTLDEVLRDVRLDTGNAELDPIANTGAKMALEMVSRLWYERKGAL